MDYKELIKQLVDCDQLSAAIEDDNLSLALENAADAIETLLAERDAAVEDLYGDCIACAHSDSPAERRPCSGCCYYTLAPYGKDYWQWRGPQKGENHDEAKL